MKTKLIFVIFFVISNVTLLHGQKKVSILKTNGTILFNNGQSVSTLRTDGTILLNNQPFFPIGYYGEGFGSLAEHKYLVDKLSAAGFNITYTEYQNPDGKISQFFDYCASKGIYNLVNFYNMLATNDVNVSNFVNTYKTKPSILFWGVTDDANNYLAKDIKRKHNLVEAIDANHLTYQSFYNGGLKLDSVVDEVGISAMQSYPIFVNGNIDRDWEVFNEIVTKCRINGKASIANLQVYRWPNNANYRWPTPAELDVQTYLATVAGFKGILFYTFKDYRTNPTSTVDFTQQLLWDKSKQYAAEVKNALSGAILNGNRTAVKQSSGIYYAKWVYNNEEIIVAINAKNTANSIIIPTTGSIASNVFNNRNATLTLSNGNLSGTLGAMEVQIYKITNSVLPITLTTFTAVKQPNTNQITWQTASETNNNIFELEQSDNGLDFTSINTQKSKGNSANTQNYFFNDNDKSKNTVYYRLKQTDFDGKFTYSNIISLKSDFESKLSVYPNPFSNKVNISASKNIARLKIISASGKTIVSQTVNQKKYVLAGAHFANGVYILEVVYNDGMKETTKLLKQ